MLLTTGFFDVAQVAILTATSLLNSCSLCFPTVALKNSFLIIFHLNLVTIVVWYLGN